MNLVDLRKQAHMTQTDLAKKLRVHQTVVSDWERGKRKPLPKNMKKMKALFGEYPEDLRGGVYDWQLD